jgi:hypothetical protein
MGSTENTYFELEISAVKSVSGFSVNVLHLIKTDWYEVLSLRLKLELNQAVAL